MAFNRKFLLATSMIAGVAIASPSLGFAQSAEPAGDERAEAQDASEVEELVVTGSRIRRNEFTSSAPIQVITGEQSTLEGMVDTGELLQSSSIAAGSPQINGIISSAFVTDGGPGSSTISLRGLGANRTLVLMNGRRAGPAGVRGAVSAFDLNVLPQSVIERVEILKDGASSVYGSDAVAGVVNIITKTNLDGGNLEAYGSRPFEDGGEQYRVSGSWGKVFDRGSLSIAADYYTQKELKVGDREYTNCAQQYRFDAASGERNDLVDPRTGQFACRDTLWGHIWLYDYSSAAGDSLPPGAKLQYDYDGDLGSYIPQRPAGYPTPLDGPQYLGMPSDWYVVDYDRPTQSVTNANHPFIQDSSLIPEVERATVMASGSFDLTSNVEGYAEVLLNRRESRTNGFRQFWTYLYTEDAFGGGDPFSAGFSGDFLLSPTAITDHFDASQKVDYARGVAGLRGDFGGLTLLEGWDWDVFLQHSRSEGSYTQDVLLDDAVTSAAFRTGSCVGSTLPVSGKPCIDVDWLNPQFLAGAPTAQEREFLFDRETGKTVYTQTIVEGSMSGDLFDLPAGTVAGALGFHARKDEIKDTPGEITLAGNSWGLSSAGVTQGEDETRELFGEVEVPLLKGVTFAENLTLNASARWTDVESYGDNTTYKLGLNWQVTPAWRLRATKGTSFRAPALFELFLADQTSFAGQRSIDPCIQWAAALATGDLPQRIADNCAAAGVPGNHTGAGSSAEVITGGGFGVLEAETSEATTLGLIWTPAFIDLSVALDYFEIEIEDEVTQLGAANIVAACYNSPTFPTDPICNQFDRNPGTQLITEVRDSYINVANQSNRGIDLTSRYRHELPWGDLSVNGQFTWQLEDTTALFAGTTVDANGDVGDPDWVGNTEIRFDRGDWTFFWGVDMIGRGSAGEDINNTNLAGTTRYKVHAEFTAYHDFSVRKQIDDWMVLGGVLNVFDEQPPAATQGLGQYSTQGYSVLASQYDYLGRRVFINVSKRF